MHRALPHRLLPRVRRVLLLAIAPLLVAGLLVGVGGSVLPAAAAGSGVDISAGGPAAAPFAALTRPNAEVVDAAPTLLGAAAGVFALLRLVRVPDAPAGAPAISARTGTGAPVRTGVGAPAPTPAIRPSHVIGFYMSQGGGAAGM